MLYSEVAGSGRDVALLHGWGLHSGVWSEVVAGLALEFRMTTIDLPGHGYSSETPERYQLDELAAQVAEVAPAEALWIGWSLGGMVALQLAADYPQRVSGLVTVCTSPHFVKTKDWRHAQEVALLEQFAQDLEGDYRAALNRFLALEVRGSDRAREELRVLRERLFARGEPTLAGLRGGLDILRYGDLRSVYANLDCPSLSVLGERDGLVPLAVAKELTGLNPYAAIEVIAGAGHAPFISHFTDFMHSLRRFLYV